MEVLAILALLGAAWIGWNVNATRARRKKLMEKYNDAALVEKLMQKTMWQGMTSEQLVDSLGDPAGIDEKIYKTKVVHTYKYNQTGKNRFGTRVKLEGGYVVGWDVK